jgi:hypothetical protein
MATDACETGSSGVPPVATTTPVTSTTLGDAASVVAMISAPLMAQTAPHLRGSEPIAISPGSP